MPSIVLNFTTSGIAALTTTQIQTLSTDDISQLSTAQVGAFTTSQIAVLTSTQVGVLTTAQIANLSTTQVVALTANQTAALGTDQISVLVTGQIAALKTSQIVALTTDQTQALTSAQIQSLSSTQIQAFTTSQTAALETANVAVLSTGQVTALKTSQFAVLTTDQVVALTTAQVASLTTSQLLAFDTSQVAAMETTDVAVLKTTQIASLKTTQIQALTTDQVQALTTASVVALTTKQIAALTTTQVEAMTSTQAAVLTSAQIPYLTLGTPLVLDLNGDGISTTNYSQGVKFDLFAQGQQVQTGWVSSSDGLLVLDRNHDGSINDGSELFGSSTLLSDGTRAKDGYQALGALDTTHDGVISADDSAFNDLRVWVDANSDGISSTTELRSLSDLGITKLNLNATLNGAVDNGNLVGLSSTYETSDGSTHAAADVWFVADANAVGTGTTPNIDTQIVQTLAQLQDSYTASTPAPAQSATDTSLVGRVSVMAQSLTSFSQQQGDAVSGTQSGALLSTSSNTPASPATLVVSGMSEQLRNYDAFGKPLSGSPELAAVTPKKPDGLQTIGVDSGNGMLTIGGSK